MRKIILSVMAAVSFAACKNNENKFDASGTFETTEVIVSSELNGKILLTKGAGGSKHQFIR